MSGQEWLPVSCSCKILSKDSTNPGVCVWEMGTLAEDLDCNWVSAELCEIPNTHCPEAIRMWNLTGGKVWSLGQALTERSEPLA